MHRRSLYLMPRVGSRRPRLGAQWRESHNCHSEPPLRGIRFSPFATHAWRH